MVTTLSAENCKTKKIDTHTQKSFFSKKVSKSHFSARNKAYTFNTQNFTTNETSLKTEGRSIIEVS